MTRESEQFRDAFNMLCGERIGGGQFRDVFECKIRRDLVCKVEIGQGYRSFANVREFVFWSENCHRPDIARWLAPLDYISPDAWILLQKRVRPVDRSEVGRLPRLVPRFLDDLKPSNFGWMGKQLVCMDYHYIDVKVSNQMVTARWNTDET